MRAVWNTSKRPAKESLESGGVVLPNVPGAVGNGCC